MYPIAIWANALLTVARIFGGSLALIADALRRDIARSGAEWFRARKTGRVE